MQRKSLAWILAILMVLALLPTGLAFAAVGTITLKDPTTLGGEGAAKNGVTPSVAFLYTEAQSGFQTINLDDVVPSVGVTATVSFAGNASAAGKFSVGFTGITATCTSNNSTQ